ncbi:RNA 2'-phosphotransferase [Paraburkholderia metrosideri]|uniref:Probable RNA 2'-phosphotransferase n=1 Tax=Paraburkholderia metrosideri TaxID=580937 RepID=A0ABM8NBZ2_9BURK|nr:RNA 2'-phosphotransferase [Paraburkholderia metrosideri]CAD6516450.1 putative RNA 2'-phosphotransferase [Paraburkholderia metrosideri]
MSNEETTQHASSEHIAVSRVLSKILRHEPDLVGIHLDAQGWVAIDELVHAINRRARAAQAPKRLRSLPNITRAILLAVVASSDKRRFSISPDGKRLRAAQGHSLDVDLGYADAEPPPVLYHGTAWRSWPAIAKGGLKAGSRHAVHLSLDVRTAARVGERHGRPVVLEVDAVRMHSIGFSFSRADNGVWLVSHVPAEYLRVVPQ